MHNCTSPSTQCPISHTHATFSCPRPRTHIIFINITYEINKIGSDFEYYKEADCFVYSVEGCSTGAQLC